MGETHTAAQVCVCEYECVCECESERERDAWRGGNWVQARKDMLIQLIQVNIINWKHTKQNYWG